MGLPEQEKVSSCFSPTFTPGLLIKLQLYTLWYRGFLIVENKSNNGNLRGGKDILCNRMLLYPAVHDAIMFFTD
jgi:hypothetical protein